VIPGGIYHRQGGRHINPYVYDDIKTIADHRHRSAHGGARIYLADEFPRHLPRRIFMANLHEHAVLTDVLEPRGSGFVGRHGDETLLANDPQWIGFSIEIGPDGAVYVLDWHDADICGNSSPPRTPAASSASPPGPPRPRRPRPRPPLRLELVELQLHRNDWYVRRARVLLQQRAAEKRLDARVHPRLRELLAQQTDPGRQLRAVWALHVTGGLPREHLLSLLAHPAAPLRAWAIPLLCEDRDPGPAALTRFAALAAADPSPVVRLALAAALQRLPLPARWPIATALVAHAGDATDPNLPKMIWFAVEPLVPAEPDRALALATASRLPLVTRFIARRATAARQVDAVLTALQSSPSAFARLPLLEGLRDGLRDFGRRELTAPAAWAELATTLGADSALRDLARQIGQHFGNPAATAAQLATLRAAAAPLERRREALQDLARDAHPPALDLILQLLDGPPLRRDALRALGQFDDPRIAGAILDRYPAWSPAEKADAVLTLASRPETARALVAALRRQTVPRTDISAFAARQLQRVLGPAFTDFWGRIAPTEADKDAELARFKRLLTDEVLAGADVRQGRAVFERTCAPCHQLYGAGGLVGPDLTGSNRANLDYILGEIISPSEFIQEDYQLVTITTRDGRTLAGNLATEDDQRVTLRLIGQETTVAKADILAREKSAVSMMPEGLLKNLATEEVRDLIAYLRTTRQVPSPN
jgi:putative heme-binding domain-containing protein